MRSIWMVLLVGCGASQPMAPGEWRAPDSERSDNVDAWTTSDEDRYIQLSCANVVGPDGNFRCEALIKAGLVANQCVASFNAFRESASSPEHVLAFRLIVNGLSVAGTCADVDHSFQVGAFALQFLDAAQRSGIATSGHGMCRRRADGSYDLTAEEVLLRRGVDDLHFSDTQSSKDSPIEVCGVVAEHEWLGRVTCADGSNPFRADPDGIRAARSGAVAGHARCDRLALMIDHYEVVCPEQRYDVYFDMYQCGPNESLALGLRIP